MKRMAACFISTAIILTLGSVNVLAANGQGSVPSRTDTVNINDYSTNNWDRFTYNYEFESGSKLNDDFGTPTQTDAAVRNEETENYRRNKDASVLPPSYGVFSGDIPTDASSLYHDNTRPDYAANTTGVINSVGVNSSTVENGGVLPSTSLMPDRITQNNGNDVYISEPQYQNYVLTEPSYYADNSIGKLYISRLSRTIKVFEGETNDNMRYGVGHFEFTSAWDGNVAFAGHNRGNSDFFSGIWNLKSGDRITYTTKYGTRTYEVYSITKVSDTDYSKLGWSNENILSLVTCVENQPAYRWIVQASEVR